MSNGHTGVPKEVYEISPDDNNDWRKRLTYSKSFAGTMREDVNGDWVKVCVGRYQRIHVVGGSKSGVTNMWEYVKGSEADFEGAPEWATHKIKRPFGTNFVNGVDVGCIGVTIENPNQQPWPLNVSVNMLIIAERRKVENLQSRVNDANLGDALKEMFREDTHSANKDQFAHLNDLPLVSEKYDTVQRPAHYNQSGIECIDAIAASMTPAEFQAYLKGNVQKYLWRYQHKNGVEDCRKAQWYLERLVKELRK